MAIAPMQTISIILLLFVNPDITGTQQINIH